MDGAPPSARLALDEWQYFTRLQRKKDSAYYFARCNFCQQAFDNAPDALKSSMTPTIVMGRKSNMQTHLAKCPYVPKDAVLFNKAVLAGGGIAAGREEYAAKRLKMTGQLDTGSSSLHQIMIELLLQHRLPFEWVDSLSAKKLLRLAAVGAHVNTSLVPSSDELRGHILDELVRSELQTEIERLKQTTSLPLSSVVGDGDAAVVPSETVLPVVVKLSLSKVNDSELPSVDSVINAGGVAVPLQYVVLEKEPVDEDSLITGITSTSSSLSYFHGLELGRYISTQLRRMRDDQDIPTGVVMLPPSPIMSRAIGLARGQWPGVAFVWNFEDIVAFCLLKTLQNPLVIEIVNATVALIQAPEIDAALVSNGVTTSDEDDWMSFATVAQELLSDRMSEHHAFIESKVDRASLFRVASLFRALAVVNGSLVIGGRITLADSLTHLATLYTAADGFGDVQQALEVVWSDCEQPLYLLAHALHPHMRLRGVPPTDLTKLSVLSDLSVSYFSQFFDRKPLSLRGDVTSYLHVSQPTFTESFIAEFPMVDDYFRYLRDNFPELAALMQLLQSFSVNGVSVDGGAKLKSKQATSTAKTYSEEEQKKLALLEERWGIEPIEYGEDRGNHTDDADVADAAQASGCDFVAKWLRKLKKTVEVRMVDFQKWEEKLDSDGGDDQADAGENHVESNGDMPLPSQAEDDAVAYPSTPLKGHRAKKVRLAQLFGVTESTTV